MYAKINDIQLYYQIYGEGKPLLMMHGNGQNHQDLDKMIHYFAKNYQVIVPDTRAHGRSEVGSVPLDYELLADDMLALLDFLDVTSYHVVGYSDGGIIALIMGIKQPDRQLNGAVIGANYDVGQVRTLSNLFCQAGYYLCRALAGVSSFFKKYRERLRLMAFYPRIERLDLAKIRAPFLAIIGEQDLFISVEETQKLTASLAKGTMEVVKGGTHFLPMQNPQILNRLIDQFLTNKGVQACSR
ncbi:alpha/beta fold hydrolase [Listeria costaricensis]|uniref:alpha/beta fold hydrolase n=1 Tax=Listeria costaricensis TaxID=2026604 RepID=UPI000C074885|nr:alpha/beta hydrolase [Listeria costaricensis]